MKENTRVLYTYMPGPDFLKVFLSFQRKTGVGGGSIPSLPSGKVLRWMFNSKMDHISPKNGARGASKSFNLPE